MYITETQHVFNAKERDWGFTSFISLTKLHSSAGGFILQDKCIVEAEVCCYWVLLKKNKNKKFVCLTKNRWASLIWILSPVCYQSPYVRRGRIFTFCCQESIVMIFYYCTAGNVERCGQTGAKEKGRSWRTSRYRHKGNINL